MARGTDGNSSAALTASGSAFTLLGGTYLLLAHINSASVAAAGFDVSG